MVMIVSVWSWLMAIERAFLAATTCSSRSSDLDLDRRVTDAEMRS